MGGPDLHVHSTASDGAYTPSKLVEMAVTLGLDALAITDHDTVAGVQEGLAAARTHSLPYVPAVELSAGIDGRGVHILGYFVDHADASFLSRLEGLREIRAARAERIVTAIRESGLDIAFADVLLAADGAAIGRSHIAEVMVRAGAVTSVRDAFERFLGNGRPFYIPKPVSEAADVVGWIADAGGVPVLAHPVLSEVTDLLDALVQAGIAGVEAYHADHTEEERAMLADMARQRGLVTTGGSDFHGEDRGGNPLGSAEVPHETFAELVALRKDRGR